MNADDFFSAGLVIFTRMLLDGGQMPDTSWLYDGNVVFRMQPRGLFRKQAVTLNGYAEWAAYALRNGLTDVWLRTPTDGDMNLLAFANYRNNVVVCRWKRRTTALVMHWGFKKGDTHWTVTLTETWDAEAVRPHLRFSRTEYAALLSELADFAAFLNYPFFEGQFRKAVDCLNDPDAPAPVDVPYPQPTPPLPQPFLGVWNAVSYASVTGAMGSWNDSPPCIAAELHCDDRYNELTQRLIDQNRLAVTFAANEFTNPEAVSCEFPPKRRLKHDNPVDTD